MTHAPFRRLAGIAAPILGAAFLLPVSGASAAPYTCDGKVATIVGTDRNDAIDGTSGNDVIVGLGGNDVIHGRGGSDVICAAWDLAVVDDSEDADLPQDKLFGDAGNDRLIGVVSYSHFARASGGPGDDFVAYMPVDYEDAPGPVTVDLEAGVGTGWGHDTFDHVHHVHGSRYGDTLLGVDQDTGGQGDILYGHGGADVIDGRDGSDELYGGAGADHIRTGPGHGDVAHPGGGPDEVHGDPVTGGRVSYFGTRRAVFVDLRSGVARGQGHDTLFDIDEVHGSPLADVIHGDAGPNVIAGRGGRDIIRGHGGPDVLYGGGSDDLLYGNGGVDDVYGGSGHDRCRAEYEHSC